MASDNPKSYKDQMALRHHRHGYMPQSCCRPIVTIVRASNNKPDAQHTLQNEVNPVNAAMVQITGRCLMVVHGVNRHMRYYKFSENECTVRKKKYSTSWTYTNKTTITKENITKVDTTMEHSIPSMSTPNTSMNNDKLYIQCCSSKYMTILPLYRQQIDVKHKSRIATRTTD